MAVEGAQLLRQTFSNSLQEIEPKLPTQLSEKFQQIKSNIDGEDESKKNLWSSATASKDLLHHLNDLNDALDDCKSFVEQRHDLTPILHNPFQRPNFVWKMTERLQHTEKEVAKLVARHSSSGVTTFPTSRHTKFVRNASQVLDFGEQEKQIKEFLADEGYKAIGVYGMSGSEKTAFMEKVLKSPRVYKEFSPIIWVCLSDIHSDSDDDEGIDVKVVKYVLCELGSDVDKWTIVNPSKRVLLENLKKQLMSQKYLIVFEDAWQTDKFYSGLGDTAPGAHTAEDRLSDGLPGDGGGKIIITSSLKEVAQNMVGSKNLIHMKPPKASQIIGFDEQAMEIEDLLSGKGYSAIGVYGISGSGKTTLIQKVLNSPSVVDKDFSPIVWVCLSDISSRDDAEFESIIVKHILCELRSDADRWATLDAGNADKAKLLEILRDSLMSKKYLIVFDDVWEKSNFYANLGDTPTVTGTVPLSDGLPRDGDGKIIVTSKLREVAESMVGQKNLIPMKPLNAESCRLILEAETGFFQYATEIENLLNDVGFVAVGIYGPSSSANTALIHKALSSTAGVPGQVVPTVWVTESQVSSWEDGEIMSRILKHILKELKSDDVDELTRAENDDELLKNVKNSLMDRRKYVIVLADLDNRPEWVRLFNDVLRQNGHGTVIVTSRREEVVRQMVGENNSIHVRLPELETNETSEVNMDRQYVTKEIIDKCYGLPLAAKTLAKIIREMGH